MDEISAALSKHFPHVTLREKQREALELIYIEGCDVIVNLPVGYGKSLIFQVLPELLGKDVEKPVVLVVSPLTAIQKDQLTDLRSRNISCCRLSVTCDVDEPYNTSLNDVKEGKFSLVLSHPEAILNTSEGHGLLKAPFVDHVVALVIDECHIIDKWGEEFRTAFQELRSLKSFFGNVPMIALSGTLTEQQKQRLPKQLNLGDYKIIETSPDRPNIFIEKFEKSSSSDVEGEYEAITFRLCDELFDLREKFPVTLLFLPIQYMTNALRYLHSLFKPQSIDDARYSAICSGQDKYVLTKTMTELKKADPYIRLVLTTSILGMGFDPENVENVIHACPPRNVSQYFQEIGRAGRRGQQAKATLFYNARNIARNLPGISEDIISYCKNNTSCLRSQILSVFGFEKDQKILDCKCCSYCKPTCSCDECVFNRFAMNFDL